MVRQTNYNIIVGECIRVQLDYGLFTPGPAVTEMDSLSGYVTIFLY